MPENAHMGPKHKVRPEGTCLAPACERVPVERFPAAIENAALLMRLDFGGIRWAIDAGDAVAIAVCEDWWAMEALRDSLENRLGFDLVMRVSEPGLLWVCRPWALEGDS